MMKTILTYHATLSNGVVVETHFSKRKNVRKLVHEIDTINRKIKNSDIHKYVTALRVGIDPDNQRITTTNNMNEAINEMITKIEGYEI